MEPSDQVTNYRNRLFEAQEKTVRLYNPEMTEEQIQARCKELQFKIVDSEENRPMSEKLQQIWNRKIRPR